MTELIVGCLADNQVAEYERLAEHDRVMDWIASDGAARGVGLWVHGGDVYDNVRGSSARERESVRRWFETVTEFAPVVVAGGNHEAPGEVRELRTMGTRWPVIARDEPGVNVVEVGPGDTPRAIRQAVVAVLPWPKKAELLAQLGRPVSPAEADAEAMQHLRNVLLGMGNAVTIQRPLPAVLVAHAQIMDAVLDNDQPKAPPGISVTLADLALARCALNVIGHVHRPQEWNHGGAWFGYPGSPRITSHAAGELLPKGYLIARFDGPTLLGVERIAAPSTPLVLLTAKWVPAGEEVQATIPDIDGALVHGGNAAGRFVSPDSWHIPPGAEVRLRYEVAADRRAAAASAAAFLRAILVDGGAADVAVEERVTAATKARAIAVSQAVSLREKVSAYLDVRKIDLTPERRARVLGRVEQLEASARGSR